MPHAPFTQPLPVLTWYMFVVQYQYQEINIVRFTELCVSVDQCSFIMCNFAPAPIPSPHTANCALFYNYGFHKYK